MDTSFITVSGFGVTSSNRAGAGFQTITSQPQPSFDQAMEQLAHPTSDQVLLSGLAEQETGYGEERCLPNLDSWADLGLTPQQELEATLDTSMPRAQDDWANNMENKDCRAVVDINSDGVVDPFEREQADRVVDTHLRKQFKDVEGRARVANMKEETFGRADGQQNADTINDIIRGKESTTTSGSDRSIGRGAGASSDSPRSSGADKSSSTSSSKSSSEKK